MLEFASVVVALMQGICEIPDVVNVSSGNRFGEQVIVVSIPTNSEHDQVRSMISVEDYKLTVHITPMFGIGSFTGNSKETKKVQSLMNVSPYNEYGTPENKELEELMKRVAARETNVWESMSQESRRVAIEKEIEIRRVAGDSDFGNCWIASGSGRGDVRPK